MSDSNKKNANEEFTIDFTQVNDSSEIPGIAELLANKIIKKQEPQQTHGTRPGVKFNRPTLTTSVKSLKEFGTKLEIHFLLNNDVYRYTQHSDLSQRKFFGLDDLYHDMKISVLFVQEFGIFGEFKKSDKSYLFDAFGITEEQYLQFVLNQSNKILTVYVSEKSMLTKKDDVIAYAENKNANLSASSIELNQAA